MSEDAGQRDLSAMTRSRGSNLRGTLNLPRKEAQEHGGEPSARFADTPADATAQTHAESTNQRAGGSQSESHTQQRRQPGERRNANLREASSTKNQDRVQSQSAAVEPEHTVGAKRAVIVYLPGGLFSELRDAMRSAADTYTDWVLDTFDHVYEQLGDVYTPTPGRKSPLPPRRRTQRRRVNTPTPMQLRLVEDELAALDQCQSELGVRSRSEFITTLVELGLGKEPTAPTAQPQGLMRPT